MLVYASDRTGSLQLFRMEANGESRQLTEAEHLDGASFTLMPDDRGVLYFDGPSMRLLALGTGRDREVYRVSAGWRRTNGLSVTGDGHSALIAETDGRKSRVRRVSLEKTAAPEMVMEAVEPLSEPQSRPGSGEVLYRRGETLWIQERRLAVAAGETLEAFWNGPERVVYLNRPSEPGQLNSIREVAVAENADRLVSPTSQFASFAPNGNGSVFLGASANRASPDVLLLLRKTRRELTLCEHKASDARLAWPSFSSDSRRVYFHSDRHGKRAIYTLGVERLVEPTE